MVSKHVGSYHCGGIRFTLHCELVELTTCDCYRRPEAALGYGRAATRYALPHVSHPLATFRRQRVSKPVANQCHEARRSEVRAQV